MVTRRSANWRSRARMDHRQRLHDADVETPSAMSSSSNTADLDYGRTRHICAQTNLLVIPAECGNPDCQREWPAFRGNDQEMRKRTNDPTTPSDNALLAQVTQSGQTTRPAHHPYAVTPTPTARFLRLGDGSRWFVGACPQSSAARQVVTVSVTSVTVDVAGAGWVTWSLLCRGGQVGRKRVPSDHRGLTTCHSQRQVVRTVSDGIAANPVAGRSGAKGLECRAE